MARFATLPPAAPANRPFSLGPNPTPTTTFEGGAGFLGSPELELFNAAVAGFLADGFYESGEARVARLVGLVPKCDPTWLRGFVPWLRDAAGLRSAPVVLAAEYARAGFPGGRGVVASSLRRADEPGELLGYWLSRYGRNVPSRVKRGIGDACARLYTERAMLRYDGQGKGWRFGDVIEFVHPTPSAAWQSALYRYALDRRRHPNEEPPAELTTIVRTKVLDDVEPGLRRANMAEAAALFGSWERLAGWITGGMDAAAWEAAIPTMGYFATLRNLNNFDRARISRPARDVVTARLTDAEQVRASRVLPFRFLSAYRAAETDNYKVAIADAADHALANLPAFGGRTLIMVDCSPSMTAAAGAGKSRAPLSLSEVAGFMAEAIARRCDDAVIATYGGEVRDAFAPLRHVPVVKAGADERYAPTIGDTRTWGCTEAVTAWWIENGRRPDRIVVLTDEQTTDAESGTLATVPVITWNLAGYSAHHAAHGNRNRWLVAGFNDSVLQVLPSLIAMGGTGRWPWES